MPLTDDDRLPRAARRVRVGAWRLTLLLGAVLALAPDAFAQGRPWHSATPFGTGAEISQSTFGIESVSPLARVLREAREAVDLRQFARAYALLEPKADLYAGDVEFDFLYGVSALEAGHPGDAVLALERVLIAQPENLQARAEIARAYAAIDERENAKREFETLAAQAIPPQAKRTISRYLDALERAENRPQPTIRKTAQIEIGYDDNVNVGTSASNWLLADGTRVIPLPQSQPDRSGYIGLSAAFEMVTPIDGRLQWMAGLRGAIRNPWSAPTLDTEQVDVSAGLAFREDCHQFTMLGQLQFLSVDADPFRQALGLVGQWQCDITRRQQVGVFVERYELEFSDQPQRDAIRQSLGVSFAQVLPFGTDAVLLGTLQTGSERSEAGLPNLSFDFTGLRMLLTSPLAPDWRGLLGFNWEVRRFDGPEPLFGVVRDDRQTEVRLGLEHQWLRHWTLLPQIVHTRNRSSLAPSDFSRTQAQLVARYSNP